MAEKKSSGFRTFLLLFFTVALAVTLGIAAFLILAPNATIFGIKYLSLSDKIYVTQVGERDLHFSSYDKIIINASNFDTGNANVNILITDELTSSQVTLKESVKGFVRDGFRTEYSLEVTENNHTLHINLIEPEMNFLTLSLNTTLYLYIHQNENIQNIEYQIITNSGDITIGDRYSAVDNSYHITTPKFVATTNSGKINIRNNATITSTLELTTKTGAINVLSDQNCSSIKLSTNSGVIKTENFTNNSANILIQTQNTHVYLKNIAGNLNLDISSGLIEFGEVGGNLSSTNKITSASIKGNIVKGEVSLIKDSANFICNIKEVHGTCNISAGSKNITIEKIYGKTNIKTTNGMISVTKVAQNNNDINLQSLDGLINIKFESVLGNNNIYSKEGNVVINYNSASSFYLTASSSEGNVYLSWLDSTENPVNSLAIGQSPSVANVLVINQEDGKITINRE